MSKRETNTIRLLRQLRDGKFHTTWTLTKAAGTRFGGRLHELRKAYGIDVELRHTGEDTYEYRWRDSEAQKAIVLSAVERGEAPQPMEPKQLLLPV